MVKLFAGIVLLLALASALSLLVRSLDWAADRWMGFRLARYTERERRPYFPNCVETLEDVSVWLAAVGVLYLVLDKYGRPWYSHLALLAIGPAVVMLRHERQQYQSGGKVPESKGP